jgi:hypothetical protein
LKKYAEECRRKGGQAAKIRVIVHTAPFHHFDEKTRRQFMIKFVSALTTTNRGHEAHYFGERHETSSKDTWENVDLLTSVLGKWRDQHGCYYTVTLDGAGASTCKVLKRNSKGVRWEKPGLIKLVDTSSGPHVVWGTPARRYHMYQDRGQPDRVLWRSRGTGKQLHEFDWTRCRACLSPER